MLQRMANLPTQHSFFLFGARGTGKSTFLKEQFDPNKVHYINLLNIDDEEIYARRPEELKDRATSLSKDIEWILIDEIQKVPQLLEPNQ